MMNFENIERLMTKFEDGTYIYVDGKIYRGEREVKGTKRGKGKYLSFDVIVDGIRCKPLLHSVIYSLFHGIDELKKHETIDHVDGDKYNNRIENLEGCSVIENNRRWYMRYYNTESTPF